MAIGAIAIVHIDEDGQPRYLISGDERFRLFVVDERAQHDRVYEMTQRSSGRELSKLLGNSPIGHCNDERHKALEAVILQAATGKKRLEVVKP